MYCVAVVPHRIATAFGKTKSLMLGLTSLDSVACSDYLAQVKPATPKREKLMQDTLKAGAGHGPPRPPAR